MSNEEVDKNPERKKREKYNVLEKCNILHELEKSGAAVISKKYSIPRRTLRRWVAQKKKLIEQDRIYQLTSKDKRVKGAVMYDLEEALYIWFDRNVKAGAFLPSPLITAKARELHSEFGMMKNFVASERWFYRWKKKYNIQQYIRCIETMLADVPSANTFKIDFQNIMDKEELLPCQIFDADETDLNFKQMPKRTLVEESSSAPSGFKVNKDRVTIMLCSNADGSLKMPLIIIGKSAESGAINKQIESNNLPVYYASQKRAWMNAEIFTKWFKDDFVKRVKQFLTEKELPVKAKLLLDNASCHLLSNELIDGDIRVMYLPANITSTVQPMNQGIIETFKKYYRSLFLIAILYAQKNGIDIVSFLKSVNIEKVIDWVSHAWNNVKDDTIFKCWKQILPDRFYTINRNSISISNEAITDEEILRTVRQINDYALADNEAIQKWITHDSRSHDVSIPTNAELVNMMSVDNDAEEPNVIVELNENVHPNDAVAAANTLLSFFEKNPALPESNIWSIKEARLAAMKIYISK
ncbi:jerky protein homolog-like [Neodiprion lecontei]|uniref:Jerky protein homolog-like n=1 Tax=Neodiprion lecontei TaxID=441921 RepID=A0ABM3FS35_NEOLC|nr:jerky protein homolog-like [Neodiprion lecontei]